MTAKFKSKADSRTVPVTPVESEVIDAWLKKEPKDIQTWVKSSGFRARPGQISLVSAANGALSRVLLGVENHDGFWDYAALPKNLPANSYRIDARMSAAGATAAATGWALGGYPSKNFFMSSWSMLWYVTLCWNSSNWLRVGSSP